jgi:DNA-binding transcriptional LysR family regulator
VNRFAAMETFIRVVDTGSFSAAAKLLSIGQPAVSKTIAQLEERLGVRLLMRSSRGLMPTEAGQKFYERAGRVIEGVDEAEFAARGAGAGLVGRLRVSAAVTFARLHVVQRLPVFLDAHPNLSIDLVLDDRVVKLVEEGIDIAFRMGTLRDSTLTVRKVATRRRLVLGAPGYFERAGTPLTPTELIRHETVIYTQENGGDTWSFRQGASEMSISVRGRLRVSAAEGVRAAVLAGAGLTVASEWMFAPELASGAVRPVLTEWTLPPMDLWAVFPTARMPSTKARTFAAFMEAELRKPHSACPLASKLARSVPEVGRALPLGAEAEF